MKTLNTTIRALLATALLGIATLAQAALCITGPAQGVPGTGFTPVASLERLEVRAGRPGNQDWEWGLGNNTQQAGQFITAQLNWVNDRVYSYTLTYNGAGAATLTVSDGSTTLFTRSWATGMDTGNALRFYIKANAGIGAGNRISATITAINGQAVNESLATSGNNLFEEQARFFTSEGLRTGFTVEGTVKLTFTGSAPPQGSRLNLMVNAGNIACETQANAQLYFIHTDHLNTPRLITNTVGLPVWRWDNDDPY
ncbi:MAG: choice-of-anchor W domain-containing protein, partial [Phycisphaerae bacterium]